MEIVIATHSGPFHADDVFACATLLRVYPEAQVVRTRNPEVIAAADVVFDVGAEYDPDRLRFDHHQRDGAGARENGVPYSSFGLVWRHFSEELLGEEIASALDEFLVQGIDALDCGYQAVLPVESDDTVRLTSLSGVISGMNPLWNVNPQDFDGAFMAAVEFAGGVLERKIAFQRSLIEARELVLNADRHEDGQLLVLEKFCPWQNHLLDSAEHENVLFVLFDQDGTWMIFQVPEAKGSFGGRKSLPESWAGLRDQALADLTGVEDAVFCHPGRFCGGARSLRGALALAGQAVKA